MARKDEQKSVNVLLVEDDDYNIELTLEALKDSKLPIAVHVVCDGLSAMAFLHRERQYAEMPRPNLILLDLNLPMMDGKEVLNAVRKDASLTDIPIIILTTSRDEEDIAYAYKRHANCYITKPSDFIQYSEIIKKIEDFWLQFVTLPHRRSA